MPRQSKRRGGRFILSDSQIDVFRKNTNSNSYRSSPRYSKELVKYVIDNSTISPLSKGTYGITFRLKLNQGVKSPFLKINSDKMAANPNNFYKETCLDPVTTFLLKISFIDDTNVVTFKGEGQELTTIKSSDFLDEARIQDEIYEKTFDLTNVLVPACVAPAIIYSLPTEKPILDKLKSIGGNLSVLNLNGLKKYGLILMEFADGYDLLWNIHRSAKLNTSKDKAFALYKMGHLSLYKAGFVHVDHHFSNAMVDIKNNKVMIIDFGQTKKIGTELLDVKKENYPAISKYIMAAAQNRKDCGDPCKDFFWYKPIAEAKPKIDDKIEQIFAERKAKKDALMAKIAENKTPEVQTFVSDPSFSNYNKLRWSIPAFSSVLPPSPNPSPRSSPSTSIASDPGSATIRLKDKFLDALKDSIKNSDLGVLTYLLNILKLSREFLDKPQTLDAVKSSITAPLTIMKHTPVAGHPGATHTFINPMRLSENITGAQRLMLDAAKDIESAKVELQQLKNILTEKDRAGKTLLHEAALLSKTTDKAENSKKFQNNILVRHVEPDSIGLKIIKALIDAEPSLPDIKDKEGRKPGKEFYSGLGATRVYIKRRQTTHGPKTSLRRALGFAGGSNRRTRKRRGAYHAHRAGRSSYSS